MSRKEKGKAITEEELQNQEAEAAENKTETAEEAKERMWTSLCIYHFI